MRPRDDDGVTLIEIVFAMLIMGIAGSLFTVAVIQIYRSTNQVEASFDAQRQIEAMYVRLDTEIRYARSISDPAKVSGDWYVEYLLSVSNVDTCVGLRLNTTTGELQRRQWTKNIDPLVPSAWTVLASNVVGTTPFTVIPADKKTLTGFRFQRLTLAMSSVVGGGGGQGGGTRAGSTQETNVTFTALNASAAQSDTSSTGDSNASTCTEARGVAS
ncbi:prepilin-type N-terminal cleavage/methylation domain-containing protein [Actinoplanes sp. LDG1-06]|uniref:Prepilin-type N-terminal cleavage/methylation domain-containing protein n=1 Tax=Paractinoplanes ovalisporus TaxID=2810368 RepID=A0ABS2AIE9_9ACTN|nr:prepilin-type N-terminal cleavage/methylation domain-containing protein [Actinoplanes ovalisporus]MBM2619622.1 prepilin-type N-terminal cleavage/methylation domain-containing protein [Actinoplanes ovalisporus]